MPGGYKNIRGEDGNGFDKHPENINKKGRPLSIRNQIREILAMDGPPAYLVAFAATCGEADTGAAQPKVNVKVDDSLVSTNDSNKGLQVSGTPGTWTANSAIAVSVSNYAITKGDSIEVRCTEAGTNADAADLTINLLFVYE